VADAETDLILGMHAIGPHVTDLITEGVFAKLVEGTPEELGMTIHPHPSLSEIVGESAMAVEGHPIHFELSALGSQPSAGAATRGPSAIGDTARPPFRAIP
jgi:Pyridine nucleotide-disulphide oxidoreductase, dimerisation domain